MRRAPRPLRSSARPPSFERPPPRYACPAACGGVDDDHTAETCVADFYDDFADHFDCGSDDNGDSSSCRCCEAVFPTGDPECDDSSEFFANLMDAGADHTYAYDRDDGTQMCGSCSVPSMTYDECEAIIPFSASETSNYEQDWGCTYWSDEDCPECGSSDECAAEAGCHSFCCDTYGECCGEDGDEPSQVPTSVPSSVPTSTPTSVPSPIPTHTPTSVPSPIPTSAPTCKTTPQCVPCTPYSLIDWLEDGDPGFGNCVCVEGWGGSMYGSTYGMSLHLTGFSDCLFLESLNGNVYGGYGDDTIEIAQGCSQCRIYGGEGDDSVRITNDWVAMVGGEGDDPFEGFIRMGYGDDSVYIGTAGDYAGIYGDDGHDTIEIKNDVGAYYSGFEWTIEDDEFNDNVVQELNWEPPQQCNYDEDCCASFGDCAECRAFTLDYWLTTGGWSDYFGAWGEHEYHGGCVCVQGNYLTDGHIELTDYDDCLFVQTLEASVNAGLGDDKIVLSAVGSNGHIHGGDGSDTIYVQENNGGIYGNDGDDMVYVGLAGPTSFVDGGDGHDFILHADGNYANWGGMFTGFEDTETVLASDDAYDPTSALPQPPEACDGSWEECCSAFEQCAGCTPYTIEAWEEALSQWEPGDSAPGPDNCICVQGGKEYANAIFLTEHDDCLFLDYLDHAEIYGLGGDDTIVIRKKAAEDGVIHGGDGDDTISVTWGSSEPFMGHIEGGYGDDTVFVGNAGTYSHMSGGSGYDQVILGMPTNAPGEFESIAYNEDSMFGADYFYP